MSKILHTSKSINDGQIIYLICSVIKLYSRSVKVDSNPTEPGKNISTSTLDFDPETCIAVIDSVC